MIASGFFAVARFLGWFFSPGVHGAGGFFSLQRQSGPGRGCRG